MIRRLMLTIAIISLPAAALADDATTLGPSTSSTTGGTSDTGTSSLLQPAGTSSLQSSGEQGSGITQAPTNNNLQPAGTADANKDLLVTESSGTQHQLENPSGGLNILLLGGLAAFFVLGLVGLMFAENRRLRLLTMSHNANDNADKDSPTIAEKTDTQSSTGNEPKSDHQPDPKETDTKQD